MTAATWLPFAVIGALIAAVVVLGVAGLRAAERAARSLAAGQYQVTVAPKLQPPPKDPFSSALAVPPAVSAAQPLSGRRAV